ncbi:Hsp20/alpha crystallin family protein [Halopiger djelfimassiliensis]|uniref:Hsp20/alpha crystallin family protein n=1 Tax=Halopiger djelfimassiliensis TaxID=1293047 RepID=UPI000677CF08|nr:Hsp20/alpha crystallin family protein [Halopiger djelfimassiliensis]
MAERSGPFDGIRQLVERLNSQLEQAARSWDLEADTRSRLEESMGRSTSLDLADEGDAFVVTVDVPGYETDDIEIRLSGETLSIRGERERRTEHEADDGTFIRRERTVQSFSRHVTLPASVDADGVDATVNNGILTVRLPKREPTDESRSIQIE